MIPIHPGGPTIPQNIGNHIGIDEYYPCIACGGRHDEVVGPFHVNNLKMCCFGLFLAELSAPEEHLNGSNPPRGAHNPPTDRKPHWY
jgi:hypothetical protein